MNAAIKQKSKANTLEDFGLGDTVNVFPLPNDAFDNFTGIIIARRGPFFIVEDQDPAAFGETWDCLPEQVSPNTDDIVHEGED